jgi:tagatose 6-phosphate kinase
VTVVDAARATVFNEPGGPVSADEWAALRAAVASGLEAGSVLVLSGSLPADCPIAAYAELVELARERRVPVLVDAAGEALQRALGAGPDLVKPNAAEAAELVGHPVVSTADAVAAARALQTQGARGALVSRGAGGVVVVDGVGAWAASLPVAVAGNPTGAGDALAAAVAAGMLRGDPWPDVLRRATAVAAAAVREPVAGAVDPAAAAELCSAVEVTEL